MLKVTVEREKNPVVIRKMINEERDRIEESLTKLHREITRHQETKPVDYQSFLFDRLSGFLLTKSSH
jgi:hypothetical protein